MHLPRYNAPAANPARKRRKTDDRTINGANGRTAIDQRSQTYRRRHTTISVVDLLFPASSIG